MRWYILLKSCFPSFGMFEDTDDVDCTVFRTLDCMFGREEIGVFCCLKLYFMGWIEVEIGIEIEMAMSVSLRLYYSILIDVIIRNADRTDSFTFIVFLLVYHYNFAMVERFIVIRIFKFVIRILSLSG